MIQTCSSVRTYYSRFRNFLSDILFCCPTASHRDNRIATQTTKHNTIYHHIGINSSLRQLEPKYNYMFDFRTAHSTTITSVLITQTKSTIIYLSHQDNSKQLIYFQSLRQSILLIKFHPLDIQTIQTKYVTQTTRTTILDYVTKTSRFHRRITTLNSLIHNKNYKINSHTYN